MFKNIYRKFHSKIYNNINHKARRGPRRFSFAGRDSQFWGRTTSWMLTTPLKYIYISNKLPNTLLCRLRVGRSFLKSHGFALIYHQLTNVSAEILTNFKIICLFAFFLFEAKYMFFLEKINSIYFPHFLKFQNQSTVMFYFLA